MDELSKIESLDLNTISENEIPQYIRDYCIKLSVLEKKLQESKHAAEANSKKAEALKAKKVSLFNRRKAIIDNREFIADVTQELTSFYEIQEEQFAVQQSISNILSAILSLGLTNIAMNRATIQSLEEIMREGSTQTLSSKTREALRQLVKQLKDRQDYIQKVDNVEKQTRLNKQQIDQNKRAIESIGKKQKAIICIGACVFIAVIALLIHIILSSREQTVPQEQKPTSATVEKTDAGNASPPLTLTKPDAQKEPTNPTLAESVPPQETPSVTPPVQKPKETKYSEENIEQKPEESPYENETQYRMDTIASNVNDVSSLIITNDGVVYYIVDDELFCSASEVLIDLKQYCNYGKDECMLAYDSNNETIYLITGGYISIYDITDVTSPIPVMDHSQNDSLLHLGKLVWVSQPMVLSDGTIAIGTEENGTCYVNPITQQCSDKAPLIFNVGSGHYRKLLGDAIIDYREGSKEAAIIKNGMPSSYINLDVPAPYNEAEVCANQDSIFYYDDKLGLCSISKDGQFLCEIPVDEIGNHGLFSFTMIRKIDVNTNTSFAFYDKSTRSIQRVQ